MELPIITGMLAEFGVSVTFIAFLLFATFTLWRTHVNSNDTIVKWKDQLEKRVEDLEGSLAEKSKLHREERAEFINVIKANREALNEATSNFKKKEEYSHEQVMGFTKVISEHNRSRESIANALDNLAKNVKRNTEVLETTLKY